ncbi:hypothetical protein BRC64_07530 [Halobacteriales archaeon QH_10_67_22]|nr:MAG: hypothetical protein BRC64_07530 [Halobacteriales archaeon QH_10_67_22]
MPDDKSGRESQAQNTDRRQRERAVAEELERWDETEPELDESELNAVETAVESLSFPATGAEVIDAVGHHEVETPEGTYAIEELVPETDAEAFESPAALRTRVARPTVAASMKRIVEASSDLTRDPLGSQGTAYEKTLRALKAIDADDDDEGVGVITDWIVGEIHEGNHPSSRDVRRRAAAFCRDQGYEVRSDDWLDV